MCYYYYCLLLQQWLRVQLKIILDLIQPSFNTARSVFLASLATNTYKWEFKVLFGHDKILGARPNTCASYNP